MSWLRYDDAFCEWPEWEHVSPAGRWAYLVLVQTCSRAQAWDGRIGRRRGIAAMLAHDDAPEDRLLELAAVDLVRDHGDTIKLPRIDEHVPPPSVRNNAEQSKVRMRRKRAHDAGQHHLCQPEHCPNAPVTDPVTSLVTRNPGTGRDGVGTSPLLQANNDETPRGAA